MKQGLFANCYSTIHDKLNLIKHIHTHTHTYIYTHTHTDQFEESLRLTLFCYLVTLNEVDHKQRLRYLYCIQINSPVFSNNRDLFGLLAFS